MTVDEVRERVEAIRKSAEHDDEGAHAKEDQLHRDVLQAIAEGEANAPELAKVALETWDVEFQRWYA